MALLTLLLMAASASSPTNADIQRRYTPAYKACLDSGDAAQGVQYAMNECANSEYERQDGRLNQAYVMVMRRLAPPAKVKLRTLQRAWIKTRDGKCTAESAEYQGGSIAPMIYSLCLTDETIRRTLWLETYRG
jgi:uncharacterized protein YecT (DUF1311 family)